MHGVGFDGPAAAFDLDVAGVDALLDARAGEQETALEPCARKRNALADDHAVGGHGPVLADAGNVCALATELAGHPRPGEQHTALDDRSIQDQIATDPGAAGVEAFRRGSDPDLLGVDCRRRHAPQTEGALDRGAAQHPGTVADGTVARNRDLVVLDLGIFPQQAAADARAGKSNLSRDLRGAKHPRAAEPHPVGEHCRVATMVDLDAVHGERLANIGPAQTQLAVERGSREEHRAFDDDAVGL